MTGVEPVCTKCKHLRESEWGFFCDAFPDGDGIPNEILVDGDPHTEAFAGDHGIRFEAKEDAD